MKGLDPLSNAIISDYSALDLSDRLSPLRVFGIQGGKTRTGDNIPYNSEVSPIEPVIRPLTGSSRFLIEELQSQVSSENFVPFRYYQFKSDLHLIGYWKMLLDLRIINAADDYDDDYIRPTDYANSLFLRLTSVLGSVFIHSSQLPYASISTDGDGGLTASWTSGSREIALEIPSSGDNAPYIYWQDNKDHGIQSNITSDVLHGRLLWLVHENNGAH